MNFTEFEQKLQTHGENVKNHITPPFDIEGEDLKVMKGNRKITTALVLAAVICILGTSVFAAHRYLSAKQAASILGDTKLSQNLKDNNTAAQIKTDGAYKAALLGVTSGENISDFKSSGWEVFPERTYAVAAVEKTDGSSMTYDDDILITPLIEGLRPWQYNIFTMNGSSQSQIIDGILYRIIEFDSIEYFADRRVYLAVVGDSFIDNSSFAYDEQTGRISEKEDYTGTNILFELKLDASKANPQKAAEYLQTIEESWESDDMDESDNSDEKIDSEKEETKTSEFRISTDPNTDEYVVSEVFEENA